MTVEIISRSISTKVWDRAGIELATPRSAVRHASVARHVTDCAMQPGVVSVVVTITEAAVEVVVAAAAVEAEVVKYNDIDSNNYLRPCK